MRRSPEAKADLLMRCELFSGLQPGLVMTLAGLASLRRYDRGEIVYYQDTPAAGLFVVTRGRLEVYRADSEGARRTLHTFGPGEVVGEVPVFAGGQYPATASAAAPVAEALFLPRDDFLKLGRERPEILLQMLATLSLRLRRFVGRIEALASQSAPSRLAGRLLELSREQSAADRPARSLVLPSTKAALARTLGMTPETFSRLLRRWQDDGLIRLDRREVELLDPDALRAIAG
ncbi:MAG TPA: Crp/Fnr family transcriptional regulator [Candidatus Krumholzibacteria bacterium]|nr:Crp/Fnr family transcriptional regulator [Candidatus Krumholzibacteria bacterium]HPD73350.1 Crp/Fnr family transcriptional regulator [Candidatus Krumholzibacteria bacterium]HRY42129.1 Crp/Fnr family transcriptional regulator [Candidatus Krumholzibacteria bacterium]